MKENINIWTEKSIELANQWDYLDQLFRVYPVAINLRRELSRKIIDLISDCFIKNNNIELLKILLKHQPFPIKDSYVAFLRHDAAALERNPMTCMRLIGILREMGLNEILEKMTAPKEANRQMGSLFKNWLMRGSLGCMLTEDISQFLKENQPIILMGSDAKLLKFAKDELGCVVI